MKFLFITGTTGSGKTTFAKQFTDGSNKLTKVLSTGKIMRERHGSKYFNKPNGFAPNELDEEIQREILVFTNGIIANFGRDKAELPEYTDVAGVIEGFPRNVDQVNFLVDLKIKRLIDIEIIIITASMKKRITRIIDRDVLIALDTINWAALSMNVMRMKDDEGRIDEVKYRCHQLGLPYIIFNQGD